jgi:RNA polymerase sigma factor (sigma-70 family)
MEDAVGDVTLKTLESLVGREPPGDIAEWQALAAKIARDYAIDQQRKHRRRTALGHAGLTEDADSIEPLPNDDWRDPVDAARLVGILGEQFENGEMPEAGEEILDAVAYDMSHKEIASELGITESAVRNRLLRMRRTFAERVEERGLESLRQSTLNTGPKIRTRAARSNRDSDG